jgi:hypothetical protein
VRAHGLPMGSPQRCGRESTPFPRAFMEGGNPVRFPPGWLMLDTKPLLIGSDASTKMIGMLRVSCASGIGEQRFAHDGEARTAVGAVFIGDAFYPKRTRTHGGAPHVGIKSLSMSMAASDYLESDHTGKPSSRSFTNDKDRRCARAPHKSLVELRAAYMPDAARGSATVRETPGTPP